MDEKVSQLDETTVRGGAVVQRTTVVSPAPPGSRYIAAASWLTQAAILLQGAIAELEHAAQVMPDGHERALVDRALAITAKTFRECTRKLGVARGRMQAIEQLERAGQMGVEQ